MQVFAFAAESIAIKYEEGIVVRVYLFSQSHEGLPTARKAWKKLLKRHNTSKI